MFEGNTATLECPVQNLRLEDVSIQWFQRGRPLDVEQQTKHYSLSADRTRLTISGVHHGDEGAFSCTAKNEAGEVSVPFELKVLGTRFFLLFFHPSFFPVLPVIQGDAEESVELIDGDELDLECVFEGQPLPTASWTKDGLPVPERSKVRSFHSKFNR